MCAGWRGGVWDSMIEAILERKGHRLSVLKNEKSHKNKDPWGRGRFDGTGNF